MKLKHILIIIIGFMLAGLSGFWAGRAGVFRVASPADDASKSVTATSSGDQPVAAVQTSPVVESEISELRTAYGTVVAGTGGRQSIVLPLESKVTGILVSAGQIVTQGDPVAEIEPSPDTLLALQQARAMTDATDQSLQNIKERYRMKLMTVQDLQSAEASAREAHVKLQNLLDRGAGGKQTLRAPGSGVVTRIDMLAGQIIPAGSPLMEIDDPSQFAACLGIEPGDSGHLVVGQTITLRATSIGDGKQIPSTVRVITRQTNPETRLIDVLASLSSDHTWPLGAALSATIRLSSKSGLIVPRDSVVEQDGGYSLYTDSHHHAKRHVVQLGLQNDHAAEVVNALPPLHPGDAVVVLGNYQLKDGMKLLSTPTP